jgi:hypothetical protein
MNRNCLQETNKFIVKLASKFLQVFSATTMKVPGNGTGLYVGYIPHLAFQYQTSIKEAQK